MSFSQSWEKVRNIRFGIYRWILAGVDVPIRSTKHSSLTERGGVVVLRSAARNRKPGLAFRNMGISAATATLSTSPWLLSISIWHEKFYLYTKSFERWFSTLIEMFAISYRKTHVLYFYTLLNVKARLIIRFKKSHLILVMISGD